MKSNFIIVVLITVILNTSLILPQVAEKISVASILSELIEGSGVDSAAIRFEEILRDQSDKFSIDEDEINELGFQYIFSNKYKEGIGLLKLNLLAFPASSKAFAKLGQIYQWMGNEEEAEENLNKAIELDSQNEEAIEGMSRLKGDRFDRTNQTDIEFAYASGENTNIDMPYFGMEPPGTEPKLFAPGIISTKDNFEFTVTFTPDSKEFYFTRRADDEGANVIMVSRWTEKGWTAPDTMDIPGGVLWNNEPHISRNGSKFYFGTRRKINEDDERPTYGIWMMDKIDSGWSDPHFALGGMYASTTDDGSVYLTDIYGRRGLVKYTLEGEQFSEPAALAGGPNDPVFGVHPCIAPDESYIIFDCYRRDGFGGEGDLYVSFNNGDGTWSEAYNLGEKVNGPGTEFCASISPDGKYIFYTKTKDIYWVSTEIIDLIKSDL